MNAIRFRLRIFTLVLLIIMISGTVGFVFIEKISLLDAFYFTIVTIATVGYGDIHPMTPLGKVFTLLMIISGTGTFVGVLANSAELFIVQREEEARLKKLHIVISLFFSEVGIRLLKKLVFCDAAPEECRRDFIVGMKWAEKEFVECREKLKIYPFKIQTQSIDFNPIHKILEQKGDFLLRLMENPLLAERESFPEMLRAVFHLRDEFSNREHLEGLPETDIRHLAGDIKRVYAMLAREWLFYMKHMKAHYPYLFSLAVRTNPFDPNASVVVRE